MKRIMVWMLAFFGAANALAVQEVEPWVVGLHEAHQLKDMPYKLMKPRDFDPVKRYPVIVSLHGVAAQERITSSSFANGIRFWQRTATESNIPAM